MICSIAIRTATLDDLPSVMNVIDGSMLAIDADTVRERITATAVLVAVDEDRVIGTLVLNGDHIDAIAVRRARRGQGIGTALVETATTQRDTLTAGFRPAVRPFYESLGFEIERVSETRCQGVRRSVR